MIDHSKCDHERTSRARARCRKSQSGAGSGRASVKELDLSTPRRAKKDEDDNYGQTPGRREDECQVCGVERIVYRGTDAWLGITVWVGQKCHWRLKKDEPIEVLVR